MRIRLFLVPVVLGSLSAASCVRDRDEYYPEWNQPGQGRDFLIGEATYRERMNVPRNAMLHVQLIELSPYGQPLGLVAETRQAVRRVPVRWRLPVDLGRIDPNRLYAVRADLVADGQIRYSSAEHFRVLTQGHPNRANVLLVARGDWNPGPGRPPIGAFVSGNAFYRERMMLPPDAQLRVELVELQHDGRPGRMVARESLPIRTSPTPYRLAVDPAQIDPRRRYAIRGRVVYGGRVQLVNANLYPVLTHGHPDQADIALVRHR